MIKKRARELGIPLTGTTGKNNAITDVCGIEVGYSTVIYGTPDDYTGPGSAFARTGVTAILPRGKQRSAVFVGRHDLNGNGELTGTHWLDDSGLMHGPVLITNTNSVGIVRDTTSKWMIDNHFYFPYVNNGQPVDGVGYFYPVVGETWDGLLNDINGFHIRPEHALEALNNAHAGAIAEGNVGGGTGMICHDFKGGTGTASRIVSTEAGEFTLGVLVQANHGMRDTFQICGIPLKDEFGPETMPVINTFAPKPGTGSIIVILATDAPLLPWQLSKLTKRVPIGIGLLGAYGDNGSGDIFLAFSTANENAYSLGISKIDMLSDEIIDPLYIATVEAVEEAVLNALCAAETMEGRDYNLVQALPQDQLLAILKKYGKIK